MIYAELQSRTVCRIIILECQEYSKAVFQEEEQMFSWRPQRKPKLISTCAAFENPLIVGGMNARVKEFPHMVSISSKLYFYGNARAQI